MHNLNHKTMTCIIVNDDISARNAINMLINQTDNLKLIASFNNTSEASKFMSENTVDLIFFDLQIDETSSYEFIKAIPFKTFVIFIPQFYSPENRKYNAHAIDSQNVLQFQEGIEIAKAYFNAMKEDNSNIANGYFVM